MPTEFKDFLEEQKAAAEALAASYAEAGTQPPGVVTRNPDSTTPERNYVSRDNIVVSGASPAHVQAAVNALASAGIQAQALDAADVAQTVSREDYDAAVLSASLEPTEVEHPGEVSGVDKDSGDALASGGAQTPEADTDTDEGDAHVDASEPEHQQESGPDAVAEQR